MNNSSNIQEMTWIAFDEKVKRSKLAIIPCGAVEVYGRHLPLGTDTLVAIKLAEAVAEKVDAVVAPPIWCGQSTALEDFFGTITVSAESFKLYLTDILNALYKWGIRDFLFVNSHLGNCPIIEQISGKMVRYQGARCTLVDTWRFIQHFEKGVLETGIEAHGHASEAGTSMIMHLYPELVDRDQINNTPFPKDEFPEFAKYVPYAILTETGSEGDATKGTPEKGKELMKRMTDRIVEYLTSEWGASLK